MGTFCRFYYIAFDEKSNYDSNIILITVSVTVFLISFVIFISIFFKCKFKNDGIEDMATINMSFLYYIIPFSLIGFIDILNFIGSFEFICSPTPANMNGMLTGVYWFIPASYINVGTIMTTIFFTIPNLDGPGCLTWMFWSLLAQFVVIFIWG